MKITRKKLRSIIAETMKFSTDNRTMDQVRADLKTALTPAQQSQNPDLTGWEDLTDLEVTIDQLLSYEGEELVNNTFGTGSYRPVFRDFDADGIWNGGREIVKMLERLGFSELPSTYEAAFQEWARTSTGEGAFFDGDAEEYFNQKPRF